MNAPHPLATYRKTLEALGVSNILAIRFAEPLRIAAERYEIDTRLRLAAWLATLAHESARFTRLEENLNYGAVGLAKTWRGRYADADGAPNALAHSLARQPERLANNVYANRMGNTEPGDGWKYRGGGLIQVTGKNNHRACGEALGLDLVANPELLKTSELYAALSAGWFWSENRLNPLADKGDMLAVTKRVNGGDTGYADRLSLYKKALTTLASLEDK